MRALRVTVSDSEYDALEKVAAAQSRTLEELIREALMAVRSRFAESRKPLRDLPLLPGHRPLAELPSRDDLYDQKCAERGGREKFEAALARLPDAEPEVYDKL